MSAAKQDEILELETLQLEDFRLYSQLASKIFYPYEKSALCVHLIHWLPGKTCRLWRKFCEFD